MEMIPRLKEIASKESKESEVRVILVDRNAVVGAELGANPRPIIEEALADMNVEFCSNETVTSFDAEGVVLQSGKRIPAQTAIWTAGVKASPLAELLPVEKDRLGRLHVDPYLRVEGLPTVFAAGDTALAKTDEDHHSMMSCQHAMPMGKYAGHNVVCGLLGSVGMPYRQENYVTCLDLGPWGALVTKGWDRVPQQQGEEAKKVKQYIKQVIIYPPLSGNRDELFEAAAPGEISLD
jgi:NADH dehydrogenase